MHRDCMINTKINTIFIYRYFTLLLFFYIFIFLRFCFSIYSRSSFLHIINSIKFYFKIFTIYKRFYIIEQIIKNFFKRYILSIITIFRIHKVSQSFENWKVDRRTLHINKNFQKHYHALNRVKIQRWEKILNDEFFENKNVENFAIQKSIDYEYQFYWFKTFTIKKISIIFKFKTRFYAREYEHLFQFI